MRRRKGRFDDAFTPMAFPGERCRWGAVRQVQVALPSPPGQPVGKRSTSRRAVMVVVGSCGVACDSISEDSSVLGRMMDM